MSAPRLVTVAELDATAPAEAGPLLASCCGARRWVAAMVERRPFGDVATLLQAAEDVWWALGPEDWKEAFAHHPRIGERAAAAQSARARAWSEGEQSGVADAGQSLRDRLTQLNHLYEGRFGYIYLVSAAGKSADDLLSLLEARMENDPEVELRVAAAEQAKITRLRLLKLLGTAGP